MVLECPWFGDSVNLPCRPPKVDDIGLTSPALTSDAMIDDWWPPLVRPVELLAWRSDGVEVALILLLPLVGMADIGVYCFSERCVRKAAVNIAL